MLHAGALFRMAVHGLKEIIQKFEVSLRLLVCSYVMLYVIKQSFHCSSDLSCTEVSFLCRFYRSKTWVKLLSMWMVIPLCRLSLDNTLHPRFNLKWYIVLLLYHSIHHKKIRNYSNTSLTQTVVTLNVSIINYWNWICYLMFIGRICKCAAVFCLELCVNSQYLKTRRHA